MSKEADDVATAGYAQQLLDNKEFTDDLETKPFGQNIGFCVNSFGRSDN